MSKGIQRWVTIVLAAAVGAGVSAVTTGAILTRTQPAPQAAMTEAQKLALVQSVRESLVKNPEILMQMTGELERRQNEAQEASLQKAIASNADMIYRSPRGFVAGNPDGDVTVVEFFDYNCGFCKRAFTHLLKLIETDKNVRVVLKEFPIFGERSEEAARAAIAADKQGKYFEMHQALLEGSGQANAASAMRAAQELGLDIEKLKADMQSDETDAVLQESRALSQRLSVQGTPFYLVGDRAIPGAPDNLYDLFVENVAEVRKNGCKAAC